MLSYQWNTLRVGDSVFVHTDEGRLAAATVAFVTDGDEQGEDHAVGVRVDDNDETYYTWPSVADVHTDPVELTESCVHCRLLRLLDVPEGEAAGSAPL